MHKKKNVSTSFTKTNSNCFHLKDSDEILFNTFFFQLLGKSLPVLDTNKVFNSIFGTT